MATGAEGSYLDVLRVVNDSMLSKRNETLQKNGKTASANKVCEPDFVGGRIN